MGKISFLLIFMVIFSTPLTFAHPYINNASVNDANGPIPGISIVGLGNEQNFSDKEIEFLSDRWIVENFAWMLLSSIGIFMGIFGLIVYREDLPTLKFVKKNNEDGL